VDWLLKADPEVSKYITTGIAYAGTTDMLKWALKSHGCEDPSIGLAAARSGSVQKLRLLWKYDCLYGEKILMTVIRYGHVHAFDWCLQNGFMNTDRSVYAIGEYNQLEMAKYLLDFVTARITPMWQGAAHAGNIAMLQLARAYEIEFESKVLSSAIDGLSTAAFAYLCETGCQMTPELMDSVIARGNVSFARYVTQFYREFSASSSVVAVRSGVSMLRFVHEEGAQLTVETFCVAVRKEDMYSVIYLRENGCPWDTAVCNWARDARILRYLHDNGCPWNSDVISTAIVHGKYDSLVYAIDNGLVPQTTHLELAGQHTNSEITDYILDCGVEPTPTFLHNCISKFSALYIHKLLARKCPFDLDSMRVALSHHMLDTCDELYAVGCSIDSTLYTTCLVAANVFGMQWLEERNVPYPDGIFRSAIASGSIRIIDHLIRKGHEVSDEDLIEAIKRRNLRVVQVLLATDIIPTERAMLEAIRTAQVQIARDLLAHGCKWNFRMYFEECEKIAGDRPYVRREELSMQEWICSNKNC
jgi:hypothetical protein